MQPETPTPLSLRAPFSGEPLVPSACCSLIVLGASWSLCVEFCKYDGFTQGSDFDWGIVDPTREMGVKRNPKTVMTCKDLMICIV